MSIVLSSKLDIRNWLENLREFQLDDLFETSVLGRSYDIIPNIEIFSSSPNLIKARYHPTYLITIGTTEHGITSKCSCPYPIACKHQAALIIQLLQNL